MIAWRRLAAMLGWADHRQFRGARPERDAGVAHSQARARIASSYFETACGGYGPSEFLSLETRNAGSTRQQSCRSLWLPQFRRPHCSQRRCATPDERPDIPEAVFRPKPKLHDSDRRRSGRSRLRLASRRYRNREGSADGPLKMLDSNFELTSPNLRPPKKQPCRRKNQVEHQRPLDARQLPLRVRGRQTQAHRRRLRAPPRRLYLLVEHPERPFRPPRSHTG